MDKVEIKIENLDELKNELIFNWTKLENTHLAKHSTSKVRIYQIDETILDNCFPQLNYIREQLTQFNLKQFQLIVYLPYSKANFHSDGAVNRYILPIISNDKCFNLELASGERSKEYMEKLNQFDLMQDKFLYNETSYINWFKEKHKDNVVTICNENECYYIGPTIHAHINFSIEHRFVIVFDTENKII